MADKPNFGLTGLAVMGQNLARNVAHKGLRGQEADPIIGWDLFAANIDEREAAEDLLAPCRDLFVLGDKGFLDRPLAEGSRFVYADTPAEPGRAASAWNSQEPEAYGAF